MRHTTFRARRIEIAALAALMTGAVLVGVAFVGSASAASGETGCKKSGCFISLKPDSGLSYGSIVDVNGRHFIPHAHGGIVECNMAPGEPTIAVPEDDSRKVKDFGSLPVGCNTPSDPFVSVSSSGTFVSGFAPITGFIGPPALGTDSSGGSAKTDAANYPCPPTQAQVEAGDSCAIVFQDVAQKRQVKPATRRHETAYEDISFTIPYTTSTNPNCPQLPTTIATGTASVTVTPATCLQGGTAVTVTGWGLNPSDLGSLEECNTANDQPTAWNTTAGQAIPVGCTDPLDNLFSTSASGGINPPEVFDGSASLTPGGILIGTVGPPFTVGRDDGTPPAGTPPADLPTDTEAQAEVDTAQFPCPPTAAQVSAGVTCAIVIWDLAPRAGTADRFVIPITFDDANLGTSSEGAKKRLR